ncbi:MAG: decaprenyl-phosphate phosphoribosyltransferase [Phycisphaeraceae bacterium]|nr:decaprenyl-phosphate phosphoribosyltransferase [Phycisphaeraceae bacterium]
MSVQPVQFVRLMRPHQWVKNGLVVLPLIFGQRMDDPEAWRNVALATVAFCLISSLAYILNDIRDRDSDRHHPRKRHRPLAAGTVGVGQAQLLAAVLLVIAFLLGWLVNPALMVVIGLYLLLQVVYTLGFKRVVLLDVMCIAAGFVLRADAGAVAVGVPISPWLVACTFTLCLFMGFCKRQGEITAISDPEQARNHRATLAGYSPALLTQLIAISAAVSMMSYLAYTISPLTIERFGHDLLVYTMPLVCYAIFRFMLLFLQGRYHDPTDLVIRDRPFQAAAALWLILTASLVVWGRDISQMLRSLAVSG